LDLDPNLLVNIPDPAKRSGSGCRSVALFTGGFFYNFY
jgi:hypothetical protein